MSLLLGFYAFKINCNKDILYFIYNPSPWPHVPSTCLSLHSLPGALCPVMQNKYTHLQNITNSKIGLTSVLFTFVLPSTCHNVWLRVDMQGAFVEEMEEKVVLGKVDIPLLNPLSTPGSNPSYHSGFFLIKSFLNHESNTCACRTQENAKVHRRRPITPLPPLSS